MKQTNKNIVRENTLTLCSDKGGSGKTTTATNLYFALGAEHLLNLDPKGTYEFTNYLRKVNGREKINFTNIHSKNELKSFLLKHKNERIIIDCGGYESELTKSAISISKVIVTTISDSLKEVLTLKSVNKTLQDISEATGNIKKAHVLINRVEPNQKHFPAFEKLSESCPHLERLNSVIHYKAVFKKAERQGLTVPESEYQRINEIEQTITQKKIKTAEKKAEGKTVTLRKYKKPEMNTSVNEIYSLAEELNKLIEA